MFLMLVFKFLLMMKKNITQASKLEENFLTMEKIDLFLYIVAILLFINFSLFVEENRRIDYFLGRI